MQPPDGTDASGYARVRVSDADRERRHRRAEGCVRRGPPHRGMNTPNASSAPTARGHTPSSPVSGDLPAAPPGTPPSQARPGPAGYLLRPAARTNPLAITSLACGLIPVLPATIAAIVLGVAARHQIRQTGQRGAGLAVAGLALGALLPGGSSVRVALRCSDSQYGQQGGLGSAACEFRFCPVPAGRGSCRRTRERRPQPAPCRQAPGQSRRRGPGPCAAWPVQGTTGLSG